MYILHMYYICRTTCVIYVFILHMYYMCRTCVLHKHIIHLKRFTSNLGVAQLTMFLIDCSVTYVFVGSSRALEQTQGS